MGRLRGLSRASPAASSVRPSREHHRSAPQRRTAGAAIHEARGSRAMSGAGGGGSTEQDPPYVATRERIARYYAAALATHGPTPRGVDWNSAESQELRFTQLLTVV